MRSTQQLSNLQSALLSIFLFCNSSIHNQRFVSSFSVAPRPSAYRVSHELNVVGTRQGSRFNPFSRTNRRENDGGSSNSIIMEFTGTEHVETQPVMLPNDQSLLNEFFSNSEYRGLLFPDNDATILDRTISNDYFNKWCKEANARGAYGPTLTTREKGRKMITLYDTNTEKIEVMKMSAALKMPSLEITSVTTIGVKLLLSECGELPELQFTLLDSQLILQGSKAAKWIFNKVMKYRDSTSSFTQVTAKRIGEKDIAFTTDARLGIKIRIPSAALKYMPSVNVHKFEEQGSRSIQKLLEKDLEPALVSFRNAFETFAAEKDTAVKQTILRP